MKIVGKNQNIFVCSAYTADHRDTHNTAEISEISGVLPNIGTAGTFYNWYQHIKHWLLLVVGINTTTELLFAVCLSLKPVN